MQRLAPQIAGFFGKAVDGPVAVLVVAENRIAEGRGVHAYLMRAPFAGLP